jgi:transcriptional regulator with GAF, ATPase, and Fis domain
MDFEKKYVDQDLLRENVEDFEKHIIVSALKRTRGNQAEAARQLGTTFRIFSSRVRKYGIDVREFFEEQDSAKKKKKPEGSRGPKPRARST